MKILIELYGASKDLSPRNKIEIELKNNNIVLKINKIVIFLLATLLTTCSYSKQFHKYILPSESPCVDGIMINIKESGCISFYWGMKYNAVKIRCTASKI